MINETELLELAKDLIGIDEIELDTPREDIEEWDSLLHVMLVSAVVENFNIIVPMEEIGKITCLRDFMKYEK